ncbi:MULTISPECIES: YqaJ viral recombinase family protein [Acidovorax]|uniref:YqaJ viral recombinase family protein n=1 Tax=Acidovorax facilis TaxID=12917 RepID=A0ABV8D8Q9_9BURK|nr:MULTISPECIES: YqaJ viral recombinase family protein [Acidovorax]KQB61306.1 endonuclease [Acidovorax sp. SD340]MBO1010053.1 YqaJ viral recombinase family protein [Acidovorax sp. SD340]MCO4243908.1 YqaJ viral recombinase family protein [Acidovorax facilis]
MVRPVVSPGSEASPRPRPALRLVKTQDLDRDQWLQVRKGGIGSSDAAAAVGLNPYQSQLELWMEKTGRAPVAPPGDGDADDLSPMYWGSLLEPIVAAHYTRRTGNRVRRINAVLQHPEHPWMLANIDREVLGATDVQLLECKTAGIQGAWLWRDGVPEYVQLQVQHQLAVTGKQAADVAVLLGGQELQIFRIERDEELIAQLITLEREFWGYVERGQAPPADGSDSADRALRALYPRDTGFTLNLKHDLVMGAVFSDLLAVREVLATNTALEAQLKQTIQQRMADSSRAVFENGEVSFKRSRDGTQLDTARLAKEQPEIVKAYTVPKPGSRRFLVQT